MADLLDVWIDPQKEDWGFLGIFPAKGGEGVSPIPRGKNVKIFHSVMRYGLQMNSCH